MDKEKALENQGSKFREDMVCGGGVYQVNNCVLLRKERYAA